MLGWDPLRFAAAGDERKLFAEAVLQRAVELRHQEIEEIGIAVANAVAKAIPR